jgi:glc operon protein GlcG
LSIALCTLTASLNAQEPARSDIKDEAKLFASAAVDSASEELRKIEHETHLVTRVMTVDALHGQKIGDVAKKAARSFVDGLFILIAEHEHELELLVSDKYRKSITPERQKTIRAAFIEAFRKRDFDAGLHHGVAAIRAAVEASGLGKDSSSTAAKFADFATRPAANAHGDSPLIVRDQIRLGLAGARLIATAALLKARELGLKLNVAVVDDGGHLLVFERMDGARPASVYTAITKATSAATFRQATGPIASATSASDPLLNISLQTAATASGGKITALQGGVPVVFEGQTIGAVGIAGGKGEEDALVARSAVETFLHELTAPRQTEKKPDEQPK